MKQIMKEMDGKQIVLSPRTHNFRGLHKEKAAKDSKQVWSGTEEGYPRERCCGSRLDHPSKRSYVVTSGRLEV